MISECISPYMRLPFIHLIHYYAISYGNVNKHFKTQDRPKWEQELSSRAATIIR